MVKQVVPGFSHPLRKTTSIYQRQDTFVNIPEPGGEAEAFPWTKKKKKNQKNYIRKDRQAISLSLHCPASRPAECHTEGPSGFMATPA